MARTACTTATRPKARPYPPMMSNLRIGMVSSRSSVPVERSRSVATEVTRNITMDGKIPSSGPPILSNKCCCPSWSRRSRASSTHGTTSLRAIVRGSWRSWRRTRTAVAVIGVMRGAFALGEREERPERVEPAAFPPAPTTAQPRAATSRRTAGSPA